MQHGATNDVRPRLHPGSPLPHRPLPYRHYHPRPQQQQGCRCGNACTPGRQFSRSNPRERSGDHRRARVYQPGRIDPGTYSHARFSCAMTGRWHSATKRLTNGSAGARCSRAMHFPVPGGLGGSEVRCVRRLRPSLRESAFAGPLQWLQDRYRHRSTSALFLSRRKRTPLSCGSRRRHPWRPGLRS